MRSIYDFIIKPVGKRYDNEVKVGEQTLITNSSIESFKHVNNIAEVVETPAAFATPIKKGDLIIVHHNVFRKWNNQHGVEKNSRSYFDQDTYLIASDQIFLYKKDKTWIPQKGYCFVKPVKSTDKLSLDKEKPLVGIVKYTDGTVSEGDLVGFRPSSEYEFIIDGEKLYRVLSNFITIKYEYQGNEEEYNPSWT